MNWRMEGISPALGGGGHSCVHHSVGEGGQVWGAGNMGELRHQSRGHGQDPPWGQSLTTLPLGLWLGPCQRLHELRVYNWPTVVPQSPKYFFSSPGPPMVLPQTLRPYTWLGIQCGCLKSISPGCLSTHTLLLVTLCGCHTINSSYQGVCTPHSQPNRSRVTT